MQQFFAHIALIEGGDEHELVQLTAVLEGQKFSGIKSLRGMGARDFCGLFPDVPLGTAQFIVTMVSKYYIVNP